MHPEVLGNYGLRRFQRRMIALRFSPCRLNSRALMDIIRAVPRNGRDMIPNDHLGK